MRGKIGDERTVRRFAFWPIWIGTEWRWLEIVYLSQYYKKCNNLPFGCAWANIGFIGKEDYQQIKFEQANNNGELLPHIDTDIPQPDYLKSQSPKPKGFVRKVSRCSAKGCTCKKDEK